MRGSRKRMLGLLVVALHLALGLGLHLALRRPPPLPASPAPVHVWITWPTSRPAPPRQPDMPAVTRNRAATARPVDLKTTPLPAAPGRAVEPQAITLPASTTTAATATTAPTAAAPAASTAAPLNLALPARPASAPPPSSWARDDPRANTTPRDAEQRMARTLGTDTTLRTVRRGDGMELRRGTGCVQVQPSRAGQILPADSSTPRPSLVGNC